MYYLYKFHNEASLRQAIASYIEFYDTARPQERYGNLTPSEVRTAALNAEHAAQYPIPPNKRIEKFKANFIA